MKYPILLITLALFSVAHAADDQKKAADPAMEAVVQKVNATGASLMPISAGAKTYRFTALNVAREFGDAGLDALATVAGKIVALDLARTKITDAGLAKFKALKKLTVLSLRGTAVTLEAAADFQKNMPQCRVEH